MKSYDLFKRNNVVLINRLQSNKRSTTCFQHHISARWKPVADSMRAEKSALRRCLFCETGEDEEVEKKKFFSVRTNQKYHNFYAGSYAVLKFKIIAAQRSFLQFV